MLRGAEARYRKMSVTLHSWSPPAFRRSMCLSWSPDLLAFTSAILYWFQAFLRMLWALLFSTSNGLFSFFLPFQIHSFLSFHSPLKKTLQIIHFNYFLFINTYLLLASHPSLLSFFSFSLPSTFPSRKFIKDLCVCVCSLIGRYQCYLTLQKRRLRLET